MATFKLTVISGNVKQDGTSNIKIRIYHNKHISFLATRLYVCPEHMEKSGSISPLSDNYDLLSYELGEVMQKVRKAYLTLGTCRTDLMTCDDLKRELEGMLHRDAEYIDFAAFSSEVIKKTNKPKTAEWYGQSLNALCSFLNKKNIDCREITSTLLNSLIVHLNNKGLSSGAISNYIRGLRSLYNKAKLLYNNPDFDIIKIPGDPFSRVVIPQYIRKRKNIGIDTICRIRDGEFKNNRANMARDVFMMMFYLCGININDLFKISAIRHNRIEYERSKVTTEFHKSRFLLSIRVEPELDTLINKYSDGIALSYFRQNYSNINNFMRAVNIGLKQISEELQLDIGLTTNWARHSWANIARNKAGIPKADIDFCLGHVNKDYKMADIYIDIDYSIIDKANRAVQDLIKKDQKK